MTGSDDTRGLEVGGAVIGFEAGDDLAELPVVAGLAAEDAPTRLRAEVGERRIKRHVAPAIAAVDADIEPGPLGRIGRCITRWCLQVCRPRGSRARHDRGEQPAASPKLATHTPLQFTYAALCRR